MAQSKDKIPIGSRGSFAMPLNSVVLPVLYHAVRGVARIKPEGGSFRMQNDPGNIQHIIFTRVGVPYALAVCSAVRRVEGYFEITYAAIQFFKK